MNSRLIKGSFTIGKMTMTPQPDGTVRVDGDETVTLGVGSALVLPGNAPAADSSAASNVASGDDVPVGPRDQFTRPWRPGDRQPTDMEQMMKPDWFKDLPNANAGQQTTGQPAGVTEIPFVNGGEFSLPYPATNQRRWILTNVTSGMCALNLGKIAQGRHPGVARISIVAESSGDCTTEIAFATVPGVFVGDDVLEVFPRHPEQSLNFQVGQNVPGNGPRVPTDKETIVNVRFFGTPTSRVLIEIAAHDQVK